MKINIIAVRNDSSEAVVSFRCQIGDAVALWRSTKLLPLVGQEYQAELDTGVVLRDDAIIHGASSVKSQLGCVGPKTRLIATIESVDDDGMAYLRLAPDCILMVESAGESVRPGVTVALDLEPTDLEVTPSG